MSRTFKLNEVEEKRYLAFYRKKKREWKKKEPDRDISFTFCFTPTGIGDAVVVRCDADREEKNITDYKSW